MSVTGGNGIGIPVIVLHDAEGGFVTIELKNGFSYRGVLDEAQDNFNCMVKNCTKISPKGEETQLEMAFVRGAQIKFIVVPEMLSLAPYFERIKAWRKAKGNPIVGAGADMRGRSGKAHERVQQNSQLGKRDNRGGIPVQQQQPPRGVYGGAPPGAAAGYGGGPPPGYMPPSGGMMHLGTGRPPPHMMPGMPGVNMMPGMPPGGRGPPMPPHSMVPGMPPFAQYGMPPGQGPPGGPGRGPPGYGPGQ
jgi:small nuclear ribonucleoprotein D3